MNIMRSDKKNRDNSKTKRKLSLAGLSRIVVSVMLCTICISSLCACSNKSKKDSNDIVVCIGHQIQIILDCT